MTNTIKFEANNLAETVAKKSPTSLSTTMLGSSSTTNIVKLFSISSSMTRVLF